MSSGSRVTTSPRSRKYQGYPYVNPSAFGVPSIDPNTANRWANLPRRPIGTAVRVQDEAGSSGTQSHQVERHQETTSVVAESKQDKGDNPVVYVDIPDNADNSICKTRSQTNQNNEKSPEETISYISDDEPVLYIDLPEPGDSDMYERRVDTPTQNLKGLNQAKTNEEDEEPMVYIDIPECSGSGVSERRPEVEDGPSTSVVQETIFYDQFKDRRIDILPIDSRDSDNDGSSSNNSTIRRPFGNSISVHRRPQHPTSLNLWSPGTSMGAAEASTSSGVSRPTPTYLPSYLTPQEYQGAFRNTPDDEFRLSPLQVTEFSDLPPAYTEIDFQSHPPNMGSPVPAVGSPVSPVGTSTSNLGGPGSIPGVTVQPQRTTVIVNENSGLNRKFLMCQNCRVTVQSIVVREARLATHMAAICFLLIGCLPCTILAYVCDCCKGKSHYCPNCNKNITKTC